jgi:hypothetical protein
MIYNERVELAKTTIRSLGPALEKCPDDTAIIRSITRLQQYVAGYTSELDLIQGCYTVSKAMGATKDMAELTMDPSYIVSSTR